MQQSFVCINQKVKHANHYWMNIIVVYRFLHFNLPPSISMISGRTEILTF